jgi:FkbM family methyltransferase
VKSLAGRLLFKTPLYPLARSLYRKVKLGRAKANPDEVAFYATLVRPGDLVFDIGANVGQKSEVFLACGARVVAVEPNPLCRPILDYEFGSNKEVTVVGKAVGASEGELDLHIVGIATTASVLDDWKYLGAGYRGGGEARKVTVPVTTLDLLIAEFGAPNFVKIDVEGFEPEVLKGLSQPVPLISFEYGTESGGLERLMACLARLAALSDIRINAVEMSPGGYPSGLALSEFVPFAAFSPSILPEGSDCLVAMELPQTR